MKKPGNSKACLVFSACILLLFSLKLPAQPAKAFLTKSQFSQIAQEPVRITRGPYLQKSSQTAINIRWRTNSETQSIVSFGEEPENLNIQIADTLYKSEHEIAIKGLNPGKRYYYRIENADSILESGPGLYFQTHPTESSPETARIWVLGDPGTGNPEQFQVRDAYFNYQNESHTDLIISTGDNVYWDGRDSEFQLKFFEVYKNIFKQTPIFLCPGNHDLYSADSQSQTGPYFQNFTFPTMGESGGNAPGTEAYYSYDFANIHFISLDSQTSDFRKPGSEMIEWLRNDLTSNTKKWVVVYFHHPPYSKRQNNSDERIQLREIRENIIPILEEHSVDLVLTGHTHVYERSFLIHGHYGLSDSFADSMILDKSNGQFPNPYHKHSRGKGTIYTILGNSGQTEISTSEEVHPVFYASDVITNGSGLLEINQDTLNFKYITSTGEVADFYTLIKNEQGPLSLGLAEKEAMKVFPNPCDGEFNLEFFNDSIQAIKIQVVNLMGEEIFLDQVSGESGVFICAIDLTAFSKGIYFIKIETSTDIFIQKIIYN